MKADERREYDAARRVTDASPDAFRVKLLIERRVRARLRRAKQKIASIGAATRMPEKEL